MRRSKTISLAEAIQDYVREMKLEKGLNETALVSSWEEIVGKAIIKNFKDLYKRPDPLCSSEIIGSQE